MSLVPQQFASNFKQMYFLYLHSDLNGFQKCQIKQTNKQTTHSLQRLHQSHSSKIHKCLSSAGECVQRTSGNFGKRCVACRYHITQPPVLFTCKKTLNICILNVNKAHGYCQYIHLLTNLLALELYLIYALWKSLVTCTCSQAAIWEFQ